MHVSDSLLLYHISVVAGTHATTVLDVEGLRSASITLLKQQISPARRHRQKMFTLQVKLNIRRTAVIIHNPLLLEKMPESAHIIEMPHWPSYLDIMKTANPIRWL